MHLVEFAHFYIGLVLKEDRVDEGEGVLHMGLLFFCVEIEEMLHLRVDVFELKVVVGVVAY